MVNHNGSKRRLISILLTFVLVFTSFMLPTDSVQAASKKQIKSVALTINKTKVTNKKVTLYLGEKCKLLVTVKPSAAKKSVKYKSSNTKVVSVDKKESKKCGYIDDNSHNWQSKSQYKGESYQEIHHADTSTNNRCYRCRA